MGVNDREKVVAQARQEAMREAERRMVQCLEGNLGEKKNGFEEHKGTVRQFYEQMFEAQLAYLKACE